MNAIVETYSQLAEQYDDETNRRSCWGRSTDQALASIHLTDAQLVVADVGCGTGQALAQLASRYGAGHRFIGVEPAANMRRKADELTQNYPNVDIREGCFERLPMDTASVDYLYSIYAFHWTTDLDASVKELARVLTASAGMDLFFTGRHNGREFLRKTSPIFMRFMGPALLLQSAALRKQLTKAETAKLFASVFPPERLVVEESYQTYCDSLEGHWGWWVRAEGHFVRLPPKRRAQCNQEIKQALLELATDEGIAYTIHQIHVHLRPGERSAAERAPCNAS